MSGNGAFMLAADLASMPEAERATWRKENARKKPEPKPKPKAAPEPAGFNAVQFHCDVMKAARQLGVTRASDLAKDAGVRLPAIRGMRHGIAPSLATLLLLCEWSGLNPLHYIIHLAPAAANDTEARAAA
jgi:hypothetical protein